MILQTHRMYPCRHDWAFRPGRTVEQQYSCGLPAFLWISDRTTWSSHYATLHMAALAIAGALIVSASTIACAETPFPEAASASTIDSELHLYLQPSEQAHLAAALDEASQAPIGHVVTW